VHLDKFHSWYFGRGDIQKQLQVGMKVHTRIMNEMNKRVMRVLKQQITIFGIILE
jgi:hypothetical protein